MQRSSTGRSGRFLTITALFAVLALVLAACGGGRSNDNGGGGGGSKGAIDTSKCPTDPSKVTIEGDTITLGTSIPQSGIYSAFKEILAGSQAYLDYLNNDLGGVKIAGKQYKVDLVAKDDAYEAAKTVANVQSLMDQNVFGLFNVVGTKNNLAIRDMVNEACVPNLLAATGSPAWGNHDYPWLLGTFLVPYPDEMKALVTYLEKNKPDATIAVLRANDDFGAAYSETLTSLVKGTKLKVVKVAQYDPETPDTKSQITTLAATKADVLVLGATLLACPDALKNVSTSGWSPLTYMSGTCTSKTLMTIAGPAGDKVISVSPLMDPANPQLVENDAMKLYKQKIAQYAEKGTDPTNGIVAYGWTAGAALQHILENATAPNRLAVMESGRTTTMESLGLMPDGAKFVSNIKNDWFLGENFTLVQYSTSAGYFTSITGLQNLNGQTASFTPPNLING